jgi:hypothetical protein
MYDFMALSKQRTTRLLHASTYMPMLKRLSIKGFSLYEIQIVFVSEHSLYDIKQRINTFLSESPIACLPVHMYQDNWLPTAAKCCAVFCATWYAIVPTR